MKTQIAVLSLLLEITLCHQFEIAQRCSMRSLAVNTRTVLAIVPPQGCESTLVEILQPKGRHRRESKNKKQETKRFSTFAVYRLHHSETKKKHCLIRESSFGGACAKEPINNLSQVTWLCTWLPK